MAVDLDGRKFRLSSDHPASGGNVDRNTRFTFRQFGSIVWGTYTGGSICRGYLVGTIEGDELVFSYAQLRMDGTTATGHSRDRIESLPAGKLRLHESWAWDSQDGKGRSVLDEV